MADILKADLCIIGAGALGRTLALAARARGLTTVLVSRPGDAPGETTSGALRRAAIMASAERAHAMASAGALGLARAEPKPSFRAIGERAAALAEATAPAAAPAHLIAQGVTLLDDNAAFLDSRTLRVGAVSIRAGQFVLATGSTPRLPDIPGLHQVAFFTPDTILANLRKLSHLLVIGGDAMALELAQAYARLGSTVTLVPQGPLLIDFDPEPVAVLLRALREEGVTILEGASVTAVLPRSQGIGIALAHADGALATLDVSHILLAAGRVPQLDADLLAGARLRRDRLRPDHLLLRPDGQTSAARITAIGGAAGAFDGPHALRQLAHVLARASGRQLLLRASASQTEAAWAAGDLAGSAKLLVGTKGAILGVSILGSGAGDLAAMLALALERGIGAAALGDLLVPAASRAALLVDLGRQYQSLHPPSAWARRWAALRQLLP